MKEIKSLWLFQTPRGTDNLAESTGYGVSKTDQIELLHIDNGCTQPSTKEESQRWARL